MGNRTAATGISIHAPLAGCDFLCEASNSCSCISIHAPLAGCDATVLAAKKHRQNFNPRTPCGVRLTATGGISAFAHFNPRTPCGVRRRWKRRCQALLYFNPRTPCGVRQGDRDTHTGAGRISIHAPLAGCDCGAGWADARASDFNPRTPCGVRPVPSGIWKQLSEFQSTHPLRGATFMLCKYQPYKVHISIHAPLAGCDTFGGNIAIAAGDFNPRTPCGVRLRMIVNIYLNFLFQSTHPLRGATVRTLLAIL